VILLEPRQITVQQNFCNHSRKMVQKHGWKQFNGDALLFEWELKNRGNVQKEHNWRHDFIYNNMKIDVKELGPKFFNIHRLFGRQTKMDQYRESIVTGQLTHFLFYQSDRPIDRLLKPGDVVNIQPMFICDARKVIKATTPSKYDEDTEAFVSIETLQIIGEEYETIT